ncbi:hypothetical protein [Nonomuraea sp. NPDC002799]
MTTPITTTFRDFAAGIVARNDENLCDYGPEEQTAKAVKALEKFHAHTPIEPAPPGLMIDLFGFGSAAIHFVSAEERYMLLSELGAELGVPIWEATKWVRQQYLYALEDQRGLDEERGDGRFGWECLRDYLDLELWCVTDNPEVKPDAKAGRHVDYGEWLISVDRLMVFILDSPWGKVFMDNTSDIMRIGMQKFMGEGVLSDVPVYRSDGNPALHDDGTPMTARDIWRTPLTEKEAREKARRGPNIPLDEQEDDE